MVAGGIMIFVWKFLVRPMVGVLGIYELLPAFIVASIFIVIVSLLTPAPEKEIVDEFESIKIINQIKAKHFFIPAHGRKFLK